MRCPRSASCDGKRIITPSKTAGEDSGKDNRHLLSFFSRDPEANVSVLDTFFLPSFFPSFWAIEGTPTGERCEVKREQSFF